MSSGLGDGPAFPRIYRGPDILTEADQTSLGSAELKHPQALSLDQIADQFLASISFVGITKGVAPPHATITDVVAALNERWKKLTGASEILSEKSLAAFVTVSPSHLQSAKGGDLVFDAQLSEGITPEKGFSAQSKALRARQLGVASPAATAVVAAALLVKALQEGNRDYGEHIRDNSFRTQPVDPVSGARLGDRTMVVKYDYQRGLVPDTARRKDARQNLWCAGSQENFQTKTPRPNLLGWLLGF